MGGNMTLDDPNLELVFVHTIDNMRFQKDLPRVCHSLITVIIKLRRDPTNIDAKKEFHQLMDDYLDVMIEHFTMRWLVSICNTIVDIDKKRAATALNIVQTVNGLFEHHRLLIEGANCVRPGGYPDQKQKLVDQNRFQGSSSGVHIRMCHTRGGIITCDMPNGDIITNMMDRLDKVVRQDEQLNKIWCRIKALTAAPNYDGRTGIDGHYDDFNGTIVRDMNHFCDADSKQHRHYGARHRELNK